MQSRWHISSAVPSPSHGYSILIDINVYLSLLPVILLSTAFCTCTHLITRSRFSQLLLHSLLVGLFAFNMRLSSLLSNLALFGIPSVVSAAQCTGSVGSIAAYIGALPAAQSFCSSKYPLPTVTSTSTAQPVTSTTTIATVFFNTTVATSYTE